MELLKRLFLHILFLPLQLLAFLIPRNKKIWIFGSFANGFVDNSKYFFLFTVKKQENIRAIWISQNRKLIHDLTKRGFEAYYKWGLKGLYYSLRGGWYIYSAYTYDINTHTAGRAKRMNLWHGIPLKKIEFDIKRGVLAQRYTGSFSQRMFFPHIYQKPNYLLSTSPFVTTLFSSAFEVPKERCLDFGYPRTDIFFETKPEIIKHVKRIESQETLDLINKIQNYQQVFVYMPTWRDDGSDFIKAAQIDFERWNATMAQKDALLILKLHPNTKIAIDIERFSHIISFPKGVDIYPVLPFTSTLITDYSSIFFDYYLIKNKDVIFFAFDKAKYYRDRDMYLDYETYAIGTIASDFEALLSTIEAYPSNKRRQIPKSALDKLWAHQDGKSSHRLYQFLKTN